MELKQIKESLRDFQIEILFPLTYFVFDYLDVFNIEIIVVCLSVKRTGLTRKLLKPSDTIHIHDT